METKLPVEIVTKFMQTAPVDVFGLAAALGLPVIRQFLDDGISGKIEKSGEKSYKITVNALHPPVRQRFTVAHEIAHFILHKDLIGDGVVDDGLYRSKTLSSAIERQANRYAADILMPWWLVKNFHAQGVKTAMGMAAKFDVSTPVAEIRLKELSLAA